MKSSPTAPPLYRCKNRKPNGEYIDGCGWQGPAVRKCPDCGSMHVRPIGDPSPTPAARRRAIVYWDGVGHFFVETPHAGKQPIGPYTGDDSLDDAITAAKAAGFRIAGIQATRGLLPAQGPSRKEGLDGNRNA